jgi:hypothetical protein
LDSALASGDGFSSSAQLGKVVDCSKLLTKLDLRSSYPNTSFNLSPLLSNWTLLLISASQKFQSIVRLYRRVGGSDETLPSEGRRVRLNVVSRAVALNGTQCVRSGHKADGVQRHLQLRASADRNRTDRLVDAPPFHGHFHYNDLPQGS